MTSDLPDMIIDNNPTHALFSATAARNRQSQLAAAGLPAARRYAAIALHMPSHIFTRLGYWQESADTNRRAAEAGQAFAKPTYGERSADVLICVNAE